MLSNFFVRWMSREEGRFYIQGKKRDEESRKDSALPKLKQGPREG
jgi:hypothetical protein